MSLLKIFRMRYFFDAGSGTCFWADNALTREKYDYAVDHKMLPISDELKDKINILIEEYDESIDWEDPASKSTLSAEEFERFYKKAATTMELMRKELGKKYVIVDEVRSHFN